MLPALLLVMVVHGRCGRAGMAAGVISWYHSCSLRLEAPAWSGGGRLLKIFWSPSIILISILEATASHETDGDSEIVPNLWPATFTVQCKDDQIWG